MRKSHGVRFPEMVFKSLALSFAVLAFGKVKNLQCLFSSESISAESDSKGPQLHRYPKASD